MGKLFAQAGNDDDHVTADEFPKVYPFIRLELTLSNLKVFVKPKHERIQRKMEKVLQTIVNVSCCIPRIERIFLSGVYCANLFLIIKINWEIILWKRLQRWRGIFGFNRLGGRPCPVSIEKGETGRQLQQKSS